MDDASLALKQACVAGDLLEVRRLLDQGVEPNSTDQHGSGTLLTFHATVTELLLSRGADPNTQNNETGDPVLVGLAYVNQSECVRILLQAGAKVDRACPTTGETALHSTLTSREDRTPLVKLLLDHGANPNAKTTPGVISYGFWRDARTRAETPLHRAAAYAPIETIAILLADGADPTIRDINGDSPLSWASWHLRDRAIIDLLNPATTIPNGV